MRKQGAREGVAFAQGIPEFLRFSCVFGLGVELFLESLWWRLFGERAAAPGAPESEEPESQALRVEGLGFRLLALRVDAPRVFRAWELLGSSGWGLLPKPTLRAPPNPGAPPSPSFPKPQNAPLILNFQTRLPPPKAPKEGPRNVGIPSSLAVKPPKPEAPPGGSPQVP